MIEVEIDVFSGAQNPTFALSNREEQELADLLLAEPGQATEVAEATGELGLGYRGLIVRNSKPDSGHWSTLRVPDIGLPTATSARPDAMPTELRLGMAQERGSVEDWLLSLADRKSRDISDDVREVIGQGVHRVVAADVDQSPPEGDFGDDESDGGQATARGGTWWACNSAYYNANASTFNQAQYVTRNNCYCFASNHLANVRFARPGQRGGRPAQSMTCGSVIDGLRADGWIDSCQVNTLTIAMVIWPGNDYHFYRVVTPGADWWWGHKPGGTPARYIDNSGRAIKQPWSPINCDRGPYVNFCGYFYQNNNTAFVA